MTPALVIGSSFQQWTTPWEVVLRGAVTRALTDRRLAPEKPEKIIDVEAIEVVDTSKDKA